MKKQSQEKLMKYVFLLSAAISIISIGLISGFIFSEGLPFIKDYGLGNFLLGREWKPTDQPPSYGILPMILGSVYLTMGAVLLGLPLGILTASYLASFAPPKIYRILKPSINLMAGIPSIVYGFFALRVLVPLTRSIFGGTGMNIISASILLAIMILPTIVNISCSSIQAVDSNLYEASLALGASHESSIIRVVLPAARSGILSSIILGIGRAIGETMALILVAGNQARMPRGLTRGLRTMTTNIVMEMAYAGDEHRQSLIATASILFIFILMINVLFYIIKRRGEID